MTVQNVLDKTALVYKKHNTAIIVAGGSGTRAGNTPKQHMAVCGIPVIVRTVNTFENCPFINEIIIVIRKDEEKLYEKYTVKYGWMKVVKTVTGGETRFESVINGFKAISDETDYVYIHDGARCLVTEKNIQDVGHAACLCGCATAATKATDTVKRQSGKTVETLDRNGIWLTQTPQVFRTEIYRASAYTAMKDGFAANDDCELAERLGFEVKPVECGRENIKITYPSDFIYAEAVIKSRENGGLK